MKNLYLIFLYSLLAMSCGTSAQKPDKISLIFLRSEIPDVAMIKEVREELFASQFTDSVILKGEEYPVIVIDFDNNYLMKFDLTSDDVHKALKNELDIPMLESKEKSTISYKQKDFEQLYRNKSIDELMHLPIKIVNDGSSVHLRDIAQIRLQLHEDQVFYQDELVYIITFKYLGKNKDELIKLLQSIDRFGVKYKVVYN